MALRANHFLFPVLSRACLSCVSYTQLFNVFFLLRLSLQRGRLYAVAMPMFCLNEIVQGNFNIISIYSCHFCVTIVEFNLKMFSCKIGKFIFMFTSQQGLLSYIIAVENKSLQY